MKIKVFLLPYGAWESSEIVDAVTQIRNAARRISKGIDISRDRRRFASGCELLEQTAARVAKTSHVELRGSDAATLIACLTRIGTARLPFLAPKELALARSRLPSTLQPNPALQEALVVVVDAFVGEGLPDPEPTKTPDVIPTGLSTVELGRCIAGSSPDCGATEGLARAKQQIAKALKSSERFRPGIRHEFLIPALREFAFLRAAPFEIHQVSVRKKVPDDQAITARRSTWRYRFLATFLPFLLPTSVPMREVVVKEARKVVVPAKPAWLNMVYQDGTTTAPFPLLALPPAPRPLGLTVIKAGLMSIRHFEMDTIVDFYLLRNAELPRGDDATSADQEEAAYVKTKLAIVQLLSQVASLQLHLYHTGLLPVLIGTYRGVVELLMDPKIRGRLEIVPMLYRGEHYQVMDSWY